MCDDKVSIVVICAVLCLVIQSCPTLCDPPGASVYGDSSGKNTGAGRHDLLQGVMCAVYDPFYECV